MYEVVKELNLKVRVEFIASPRRFRIEAGSGDMGRGDIERSIRPSGSPGNLAAANIGALVNGIHEERPHVPMSTLVSPGAPDVA